VDLSEIKRKERKSQWANRYKDRLPQSTLEGQPYEEGQAGSSSVDIHSVDESARRNANGDLWRPEDEQYYNPAQSNESGGRWHYPANFDDAVVDRALLKDKKKKKKDKKNRWERTQDAYSIPPEDENKRKSKKKKRKSASGADSFDTASVNSGSQEYPEDAEGRLYGNSSRIPEDDRQNKNSKTTDAEVFQHQF
jgi:hypothetical protein